VHRERLADGIVALLLGVAAGAACAFTLPGRFFGDGAMLADWVAMPERAYPGYHNVLYVPAARCFAAALPGNPIAAAQALSVVSAALGVAFAYLGCRRLGATRGAGVFGTLLLAFSPALWFFGSAVEVHALHFAVVAACAWVTLAAPWRRPVLATMLTAAVFWIPYLTHQSAPVLGPGWVLLVQCARARRAAPFRLWTLVGIGVVLLAALGFGHMSGNWLRGHGFALDLQFVTTTVGGWRREFGPDIVWEGFLGPLFLLVPVAVAALCWRGVDPWLRLAALALLVPGVGCVLWWGIPERGGYLLGQSLACAFLAAALATRLSGRLAVTAAVILVAGQAWAGFRFVRDFDREGFQIADRVERVRRHLGSHGVLLSANDNAPNVKIWLPGVEELNMLVSMRPDRPVADWFAETYPLLPRFVQGNPFLLDTSYRLRPDFGGRIREGVEMVEQAIRRDYRVRELDHPSWPMWLVEPR
jgi:hypothetical protein